MEGGVYLKYCSTHANCQHSLPALPKLQCSQRTNSVLSQALQERPVTFLGQVKDRHTSHMLVFLNSSSRNAEPCIKDFPVVLFWKVGGNLCYILSVSGFFFPSCHDDRNGHYGPVDLLLLSMQSFFLFSFFLIFVSLHISIDIVSFKNANNLYTKCAIIS